MFHSTMRGSSQSNSNQKENPTIGEGKNRDRNLPNVDGMVATQSFPGE